MEKYDKTREVGQNWAKLNERSEVIGSILVKDLWKRGPTHPLAPPPPCIKNVHSFLINLKTFKTF